MFEAYKVGVTLALQNQVSGVLGFIARDFVKADLEAKKLQRTLKEIKLLGMGGALVGGMGFMGLMAIKGAIKPAEDYARQLNNMNTAGMKQLEIAESIKAAWRNTGDVITSTATGNLKTILDLRQMLGADKSMHEVERLLPIVSRMQAVMAASSNARLSKHSDELAFSMAKALDIIGAVKNPVEVEKQATMMSKVIAATGGRVTPQMFQSVFQYARQAKFDMSDEFKYEILPSLMLEAATGKGGGGGGSRGVGPALAAAYRITNQGYINKKSVGEWEALGLLAPGTALKTTTSGTTTAPVKDASLAASNFFQYVNDKLVPAIRVKYGDKATDSFIRQEINQLMRGNQLAASLAVEFFEKQNVFLRDQKINRSALPYNEAYLSILAKDPKTAADALGMQWENLKVSLGLTLIPVVIPMLRNLAYAFNSLATFMQRNPTLTTALVGAFTALSVLATIGGTLMIGAAGMKLIGATMGLIIPPLQGLAGVGLAGIATGLSLLVAALVPLAAIAYHQEIADKIDGAAPGIGDALLSTRNFLDGMKPSSGGNHGFAPPSSGKNVAVHTQVNLDGRRIADVVSNHQYKATNRPAISGGGFDGRQSIVQPGFSGSW